MFLQPVSRHKNINTFWTTLNSSNNIKHCSICELYTQFGKMNKNKRENSFPICLFQFRVTGGWSLSLRLRVQGWAPILDRTPFHHRTSHAHSHAHSRGTRQTRQFTARVHLQDVGGSQGTWRKPTQAWGDCAKSTDSGLGRESHPHYGKMEMNNAMSSDDLLQVVHIVNAVQGTSI